MTRKTIVAVQDSLQVTVEPIEKTFLAERLLQHVGRDVITFLPCGEINSLYVLS